jgi:hypothetical protein
MSRKLASLNKADAFTDIAYTALNKIHYERTYLSPEITKQLDVVLREMQMLSSIIEGTKNADISG